MSFVGTLALGLLLVGLQSSGTFPFTVGDVSADLALCLVLYLALTRDLPAGGAQVVAIGLLTDVASGAPTGLHMVAFTGIFLALYAVRHRLFLESPPAIAGVTVVASLATTLLTWFLVAVFVPDYRLYMPFLYVAIPRALLTVPFIYSVRALAMQLDDRTTSRARRVLSG